MILRKNNQNRNDRTPRVQISWMLAGIAIPAALLAVGLLAEAAAAGPVDQIRSTVVRIAKILQGSALGMGVAGLINIAIKAARGKSPMDSSFSWMGAMFVIYVAGHLVEFFTGQNYFTGIRDSESHITSLDIYGKMQQEIAGGLRGNPGTGSIWNSENYIDNIWGVQPGSGTIFDSFNPDAVASRPPGGGLPRTGSDAPGRTPPQVPSRGPRDPPNIPSGNPGG